MSVVLRLVAASANCGDYRLRYVGGSSYPDLTTREITAAYENCDRTIHDSLSRLYGELCGIIWHLAPAIFSGDEWHKFVGSLPPGIIIARSYPPPSKQVHVSPATRLLLSEIIACTDEIWHSLERLDPQFEGICRIRNRSTL